MLIFLIELCSKMDLTDLSALQIFGLVTSLESTKTSECLLTAFFFSQLKKVVLSLSGPTNWMERLTGNCAKL